MNAVKAPLPIDRYHSLWRAYSPLLHLSRALGILPWSLSEDRIPGLTIISLANIYTIIIIIFYTGLYSFVATQIKLSISGNGRFDLKFIEGTICHLPVIQYIYYYSGYRAASQLSVLFGDLKKIFDLHILKDQTFILKDMKYQSYKYVIIYLTCGLSYLFVSTLQTDSILKSSYGLNFNGWMFTLHCLVINFGINIQLASACFGMFLLVTLTALQRTISVMKSSILSTCIDEEMEFLMSFRSKAEEKVPLNEAHTLNKAYTMIADLVEKISSIIGKTLLLQVLTATLHLLICAHHVLNGPTSDVIGNFAGVGVSLLSAAYTSTYIVAICNGSTRLANEGRCLLRVVLMKLNQSHLSSNEREQYHVLKDAISTDPLQLNASNVINLDRQLVLGIIGVVVSYLVVLTQSKNSSC